LRKKKLRVSEKRRKLNLSAFVWKRRPPRLKELGSKKKLPPLKLSVLDLKRRRQSAFALKKRQKLNVSVSRKKKLLPRPNVSELKRKKPLLRPREFAKKKKLLPLKPKLNVFVKRKKPPRLNAFDYMRRLRPFALKRNVSKPKRPSAKSANKKNELKKTHSEKRDASAKNLQTLPKPTPKMTRRRKMAK
jgi:hypothetical protein